MKVPFLNLAWQHNHISQAVEARFKAVMNTSAYIMGRDVALFEEHFATYLGSKYCLGVANGTDALIIVLKTLNLSKNDEVITIPNTFFASASSIVHAGAKPVFVDIDPRTRNISIKELTKAITPKTKAIVAVHLYGQPVDIDAIKRVVGKRDIKIIEDACQAHGARYKGRRVGGEGYASCFSFYPGKNLGAYGDGGAIVTNSEEVFLQCKKYRDHGSLVKYHHEIIGYNSRLDTLQAVVLDEKLKFLDTWNSLRRKAATRYRKNLATLEKRKSISLFSDLPKTESVEHLFIVQLHKANRDEVLSKLGAFGVGAGIHYPIPLHLMPAFSHLKYKRGNFPKAEALCSSIISLPMFPGISDAEIDYTTDSLKKILQDYEK